MSPSLLPEVSSIFFWGGGGGGGGGLFLSFLLKSFLFITGSFRIFYFLLGVVKIFPKLPMMLTILKIEPYHMINTIELTTQS